MKIIGKTQTGYLLEAKKDELANLVGYYSEYDSRRRISGFALGDEIRIARMYDQLRDLALSEERLNEARAALSNILKALEVFNPIEKPIIVGPQ